MVLGCPSKLRHCCISGLTHAVIYSFGTVKQAGRVNLSLYAAFSKTCLLWCCTNVHCYSLMLWNCLVAAHGVYCDICVLVSLHDVSTQVDRDK